MAALTQPKCLTGKANSGKKLVALPSLPRSAPRAQKCMAAALKAQQKRATVLASAASESGVFFSNEDGAAQNRNAL